MEERTTPLKTRSDFNARLMSLSNRNRELEENLREAERSCQRYKIKTNVQNTIISELVDAIHSMAHGSSNAVVSEDTCLLLTRNARRIANLSMELEKTKLEQQERIAEAGTTNDVDIDIAHQSSDTSSNDVVPLEENSQEENDKTSEYKLVIKELKDENIHIKTRCDSLEGSMDTLKRKHTEREVRSMLSLRNIKCQLDELELERKRRIDMQASAEERACRLERQISDITSNRSRRWHQEVHGDGAKSMISLEDSRQQDGKEIVFFSSASSSASSTASSSSSDASDTSSECTNHEDKNELFARNLNRCRETVMLQKELFRSNPDSFPPLLVTVSEDSGDERPEA